MKVGIFSGTFDPVHAGHISFALQAIESAALDKVYFLPEQTPRRKEGVTHYGHRVAMLELALRPHPKLEIMDLMDKQFSVNRTLPKIKKITNGADICMLVGSDMVDLLSSDIAEQQWPEHQKFLREVNLIVGLREQKDQEAYQHKLSLLQPSGVVVASKRPFASSRDIRGAVARGKEHKELLASLKSYIKENWLYVAVSQ